MRISDWSSDVCSSDLFSLRPQFGPGAIHPANAGGPGVDQLTVNCFSKPATRRILRNAGLQLTRRSEEHTSELQSLMRISYAVFCLKKKKKNTHTKQPTVYKTTTD